MAEGAPNPPVKTVRCTGCGASLPVRGMGRTEVLGCAACGVVLDLTDENLAILSRYQIAGRIKPDIPLGTRGELNGEKFEVIGFLRKNTRIEGIVYRWREYLLFNPYKGFRWLTEYNGHWSYYRTLAERPKEGNRTAELDGIVYKHFQRSNAEVDFVLGEFYWRVAVGESSKVSDFIAPPYILSEEVQQQEGRMERTWSLGEYLEPGVVAKAFGLANVPIRTGIAPNQPSSFAVNGSRLAWTLLLLAIAAFGIQILFSVFSQNALSYQQSFLFEQGEGEKSFVTPLFTLSGHPSNVVIRSNAGVENSWLYLSLALINNDTGQSYDVGREISFYRGISGGESWSEGTTGDEAVLPAVPAGTYYLRVEPEASQATGYTIQIYRDVPRWRFLFFAWILLCLPAIGYQIMAWWFEHKRWMESDYASTSD